MKIIRISTDLELTTHEFLRGLYGQQNEFLRELIGNNCNIYVPVMPRRLYTDFCIKEYPTKVAGQCVIMLVDDEGGLKENKSNLIGSYLYESDRHGYPIMGNILFIGEEWDGDGIDFCGIEDSVFKLLEQQLNSLILTMKAAKEALDK